MNLLNTTFVNNNLSSVLKNWTDTSVIPQTIDSVTYDLYENNNPFRKIPAENGILANTGAAVSAEIFSAFANPYYLPHKITRVPAAYTNVVNTYKKYSGNQR